MIPDAWIKLFLERLHESQMYQPWPDKYPAVRYYLPWHRRVLNRVKRGIENDRERLALMIAPWLDREEDW